MIANDTLEPIGNRSIAFATRIVRLRLPALVSCLCLLGALTSLVGAWVAHHQRLEVGNSIAALQRSQRAEERAQPADNDPLPMVPNDTQFLDDLKAIFKLAKSGEISLGVIEYKTEHIEKMPLTLRSIELKIKEDYPKVKAYLSQLLTDFPHVSLQEIRIERADGLIAQGTMLVRLMLVYRSPSVGPKMTPAPTQIAK